MSPTIGTTSSKSTESTPDTAIPGSIGSPVKRLQLREMTGVPWLVGNRIEKVDSKQQALRMIRQRISVLVEGREGVVEIPDSMIKAIEY